MARLSLATRAGRVASAMRGKSWSDPSRLSKENNRQIRLLAQQMGISEERLRSYKPSTRKAYMAAAKKGRTAAQERQRVKTQRAERARRRIDMIDIKRRGYTQEEWDHVMQLRDELFAEGILVQDVKGLAQRDRLNFYDLYSDESLDAHLRTYGYYYVQDNMRGQLLAVQQYNQSGGRDRKLGQARIRAFFGTTMVSQLKASQTIDRDERWFWYHATLHYH